MEILLVNPSSSPGVTFGKMQNMYPISLLFLSSHLYRNGYRATILDLSTAGDLQQNFENYIKDRDINIIGFTGTTENRFLVWDLIVAARNLLPKAKIIVGGDHFTFTAEETLQSIPEIDVVVRGEGEITLLELVQSFEKDGNLDNILGISYRVNGKVIHNPNRPPEMDIDKLNIDDAVIDDVILPYGTYSPFMYLRNFEEDELKALPVHVGRGCPGQCVYCLYNKKMYRTRSVDSVLKEIEEKMVKYDCKVFHLQDPFLSKRSKFVNNLCHKIINKGLDIKWYAEIKANTDLKLLSLMAKAGCISVDFALESASERVLKAIKKEIKLDDVTNIIEACKELGIRAGMFVMISLPDEHKEDAIYSYKYIRTKLKSIKNIYPAITIIYPGAELEKMAKERGIFPINFSWYDRTYQNVLHDIVPKCSPLWVEHLTPDFIRYLKWKYFIIVWFIMKNPMIKIKQTLFNWKTEGFSAKQRRINKFFQFVVWKFKG